MASSSSFSVFWKPDNFYFWRVMKPTIERNVLPCSSFYAFWRPENAISTECEGRVSPLSAYQSRNTKVLRVPSFLWPHFLHFVGLKMLILLGRDTQLLVSILTAWNFYRCRFVKTTVQGYLELCELIFGFWRPENAISAELCNPRFKGSKFIVSSFSAFRSLQILFLKGPRSYDSN